MSAAPALTSLNAQWQDWLADNVARGCLDADLVGVMVENGFDVGFAGSAVSVLRSMTERVKAQAPGMLDVCRADPIRLPQGSHVFAHDRELGIAMRLSDPNIAVLDELLDADECAELIALSRGRLRRSEVVDRELGGFQVSTVRTSAGTHFDRRENPLVEALELRIAALTGVPVECGEPLQILHYEHAGEYRPHHDYFDPEDPGSATVLRQGGQRIATIVTFLNDVAHGGETEFPELGLSVAPRAGRAVYFEYFNQAGQVDPRCLHAGRPVSHGEKWVATKWLRLNDF